MSRFHVSLMLLVACGGGSSTPDAAKSIDAPKIVDAPPVADAPMTDAPMLDAFVNHADAAPAMGTKYRYVVNSETVPSTTQEAKADGLDLNGDGAVDNQFGMVIASFAGMGTTTQSSVDTAISHGTTIMLGVLETTDFTTATSAGFMIYTGANPMPMPCANAQDTVCGHHLTGTGTFDISTSSVIDPPLVGNFVAGTLTTPVGDSTMPLPLEFGAAPFTVNMIGARVKVTGASATGLTAILAGGILMSDITNNVYPAVAAGFSAVAAPDCTMPNNPPSCGCTSGSTGATIIGLFDANHDCTITATEIGSNSLIMALFAPDLTIDGMPAISVGVLVTAVTGSFTGP